MSQYKYYDNTRISSAKNCLRHYMIRHILDWTRDGTAKALAFGSAWHEAMDIVWGIAHSNKSDEEVQKLAMAAFHIKWTDEGMPAWEDMTPEQDDAYAPRTPGIAAEMLFYYIKDRRPFIQKCKVIAIEQPFAVPLFADDNKIMYIGRLDKVIEYEGKIIIIEHKTTSSYKKGGPFRTDWMESWSPNSQVDGYLHAGHMLYGDKLKYLWIDGALVHKKIHDGFKFIPISRRMEMLDQWLWETKFWINIIEGETDTYYDDSNTMTFPKNTGACNHYAGCTFRDVCKMIIDPSKEVGPPLGFKKEHWEPFDVLNMGKLGLDKDT